MSLSAPARPLLAALLLALLPAGASALRVERLAHVSVASGRTGFREVVSGFASVRLARGISTTTAAEQLFAAGYKLDHINNSGGWSRASFSTTKSVGQAISELTSMPFITEAEPDNVYRVSRVPNDQYLPSQYALSQMQAFGAWEYETGSSNLVTVAVIDTGVDGAHPDLAVKFSSSTSQFCDPGSNKLSSSDNSACAPETPTAACYHGTMVAGIAAADTNNGVGISGMSWGAKLVSMRVFRTSDCTADCGDAASGSCGTDDWAMADALTFLASKNNTPGYGKIVANISLGCPVGGAFYECGTCSDVMQYAVNISTSSGMLIFAAAGNSGSSLMDNPADCQGIIAVGATDEQDNLAYFSNTDLEMSTKGLTAPGVNIYSTTLNDGYTVGSGTSFSSPMAAGLAALLWSAKPSDSPSQIFDLMKNSADDLGAPGPDYAFGWGRINALKAMRLAETGSLSFTGAFKAVAYPDPFRPKIQRLVSFTVPGQLLGPDPEVRIYTVEGELVKKFYGLAWDGRNSAGSPVASGVYLFRLKTDKGSSVGKLALIR